MEINKIETYNNYISVRYLNEDGSFHRESIMPDIDIDSIENNELRAECLKVFTDEVIARYLEHIKPNPLTIDEQIKVASRAVLNYLDTQCMALGFTGDDKTRPHRAIANYVGYDNEFRDDAESLGAWIALVYKTAEQIETDITNGDRAMLTTNELISELPKYQHQLKEIDDI